MGLFNTYGSTQLKVGDLYCRLFDVGDTVDVPDGVYVGWEGVVVIVDGVFAAEFEHLVSKWGDEIDPGTVLDEHTPYGDDFEVAWSSLLPDELT